MSITLGKYQLLKTVLEYGDRVDQEIGVRGFEPPAPRCLPISSEPLCWICAVSLRVSTSQPIKGLITSSNLHILRFILYILLTAFEMGQPVSPVQEQKPSNI